MFVATVGARAPGGMGSVNAVVADDAGKPVVCVPLPLRGPVQGHFAASGLVEAVVHLGVLAENPDHPSPMFGLGTSYLSDGEIDKALPLFQQVSVAAPGTSEAKQDEAFIAGLKKPGSPEARNEERSSA